MAGAPLLAAAAVLLDHVAAPGPRTSTITTYQDSGWLSKRKNNTNNSVNTNTVIRLAEALAS
jgi:hypothetical protein